MRIFRIILVLASTTIYLGMNSCCANKISIENQENDQPLINTYLEPAAKTQKKINVDHQTFIIQSFFGDGMPNSLKLFRRENNQYTCLDSMTFYFHDEILKPDTIHFDQTCNCFITDSEHSGTGVYGESIHFLIIKNNRIIQLFDQLKYLSIVDPESLPKTTFTVSTEILEFHKEEIKLKATIIQGEIQDDESGKEVENSRETDTIEYRINPKKSIYIYHNSKLPTYKERWKNGHFI